MKKILIFILVCFVGASASAQNKKVENVFLTRGYWKGKPTLADVKAKISEGNDPVAKSKHAMDATSYAILENASSDVINHLLSIEGNDVNKQTHDKRNYVMWAAYKGNTPLVKQLLDAGSKTDITDAHGYNLLTFTALAGIDDIELYDIILSNGLDVKSTNSIGANALLLSCNKAKDDKLIKYFTKKGLNIKAKDDKGSTAFHYAAKGGNIDMMNILKSLGLDVKAKNKEGQNAMLIAARGGHRQSNGLEVFKYLEGLGIDANVVAKDGSTPLHYLGGTKDAKNIDYFLSKGVDINAVNNDGNTFFHMTAGWNNPKMFTKYMDKAKNLDLTNKEGKTPLLFAVRRKSSPLVNTLIKKGANVNIVDNKGSNLVGHLFDSYNPRTAVFFYETLDILKNKGINPLEKQAEGNSIIHIAVEKLSPQLIQKAVALGADVNEKNADELTPLQLAAMTSKDGQVLRTLVSLGADKNVKTVMGESIIDLVSENELLKGKINRLKFLK